MRPWRLRARLDSKVEKQQAQALQDLRAALASGTFILYPTAVQTPQPRLVFIAPGLTDTHGLAAGHLPFMETEERTGWNTSQAGRDDGRRLCIFLPSQL